MLQQAYPSPCKHCVSPVCAAASHAAPPHVNSVQGPEWHQGPGTSRDLSSPVPYGSSTRPTLNRSITRRAASVMATQTIIWGEAPICLFAGMVQAPRGEVSPDDDRCRPLFPSAHRNRARRSSKSGPATPSVDSRTRLSLLSGRTLPYRLHLERPVRSQRYCNQRVTDCHFVHSALSASASPHAYCDCRTRCERAQ